MSEDRQKRRERMKRNRSHYAEALNHPLFRQRVKERKNKYEDRDEKRYRKYKDLTEIGLEDNDNF